MTTAYLAGLDVQQSGVAWWCWAVFWYVPVFLVAQVAAQLLLQLVLRVTGWEGRPSVMDEFDRGILYKSQRLSFLVLVGALWVSLLAGGLTGEPRWLVVCLLGGFLVSHVLYEARKIHLYRRGFL